jgi:hypothetical protein
MNPESLTHEELLENRTQTLLKSIAYCDKIAHLTREAMTKTELIEGFDIGPIHLDLHPTEGYWLSSKKTITITDRRVGKKYTLTIEES